MRAVSFVVAFVAAFSSTANAGPKEEALQIVEKWSRAFAESDVDGITKLYSPDALFFGTRSKTIVSKPDGIRSYFESALQKGLPIVSCCAEYSAIALSENAVVITGLDTNTGVREGVPFTNHGRITFVVAKRGSEWQIVQFHRSFMPN